MSDRNPVAGHNLDVRIVDIDTVRGQYGPFEQAHVTQVLDRRLAVLLADRLLFVKRFADVDMDAEAVLFGNLQRLFQRFRRTGIRGMRGEHDLHPVVSP